MNALVVVATAISVASIVAMLRRAQLRAPELLRIPVGPNLILNGSFEPLEPSKFEDPGTGMMSLVPWSHAISGWQVANQYESGTAIGVTWLKNGNAVGRAASHGTHFVDLA